MSTALLVTPSLLLGMALIAAPIILHLVMRQRPKTLVFPALRFVQQRRESNRRRLQLRHLFLLLLRCLAIAAAAAALAGPRLPSALWGNAILLAVLTLGLVLLVGLLIVAAVKQRGMILLMGLSSAIAVLLAALFMVALVTIFAGEASAVGDRKAPVAAVIVIDTSPRMQFRHENQTRLDAARTSALWVLRQLPRGSRVAVLSSAPGPARFAAGDAAAQEAIERLQISAIARPLTAVMRDALQTSLEAEHSRKEIYVFTDLTEAAWPEESAAAVKNRLAEHGDIVVNVIDVGARRPRNVSLGGVSFPAGETFSRAEPLIVETTAAGLNVSGERTVDLWIEDHDPRLPQLLDDEIVLPAARRRAERSIQLGPGDGELIRFELRGLPPGVHQGRLEIRGGGDGMPLDDVRYFTVEVQQAWPLLVAAPDGAVTTLLTEALAPYAHRQTGQARYDCTVITQSDLGNQGSLARYAAVCLLDPQPLTPYDWEKLAEYAEAGGRLAIFLGHNAAATSSFNSGEAQRVLPGRLVRRWRAAGSDLVLAPRSLDHPILREFAPIASSVPWRDFPVFMHWVIEPLDEQARVVLPYSNNKPALIDAPIGRGRAIVMTTPLSDPVRPEGRPAWNELATGENAWPYFVLINETIDYLVERSGGRLNYQVGETATLSNRPDADPPRYQLFPPSGQPQDRIAGDDSLTVKSLSEPGAYRLRGLRGEPVLRGFSANLPPSATDLTRADPQRLDEVFGSGRYEIVTERNQIDWTARRSRLGIEFYAPLVLMLALVLAVEWLLANLFYRRSEPA